MEKDNYESDEIFCIEVDCPVEQSLEGSQHNDTKGSLELNFLSEEENIKNKLRNDEDNDEVEIITTAIQEKPPTPKTSSNKHFSIEKNNSERLPMPLKKLRKESASGDFLNGDIARKLLVAVLNEPKKKIEKFLVTWRRRKNGTKPMNSFQSIESVRRFAKVDLINYYERNATFVIETTTKH